MVQAIQLLARDLATKDYKTRHSLKMMSPTEYRKFHKAEPSDQRASAHIHVGRIDVMHEARLVRFDAGKAHLGAASHALRVLVETRGLVL